MAFALKIKRVYDAHAEDDGMRVLVDRLWPRGIKKEKACLDLWAKEITPTPELRKWFGHKEENFEEFRLAYRTELDGNAQAQDFASKVKAELEKRNVTMLYAAKSPTCNHAVILKGWLEDIWSAK